MKQTPQEQFAESDRAIRELGVAIRSDLAGLFARLVEALGKRK